ncbi:MAG: lipid-binding SYLF domain-containing protein [Pseudomonadota bacterium]
MQKVNRNTAILPPRAFRQLCVMAFTVCLLFTAPLFSRPAIAAGKADGEALVASAYATLKSFQANPKLEWFRENLPNAKAVMVIPRSIKGGFIIGGSGGSGVLLARDPATKSWSYPAFYTIGSITFGLQIGGEVSEIVLLVMTERGVDALLTTDVKLGGDVSVALGPIGTGIKAQTADILAYTRSKGAYGGLNLEGAVVKTRNDLNDGYYAQDVSPADILIRRSVGNPDADQLRAAISEAVK